MSIQLTLLVLGGGTQLQNGRVQTDVTASASADLVS